ncbi:MAG: hypothetical protein HDQ88_09355 [Clostridia bacterium]|nr:hypothetical protein [Clostridia bacterium]
MADQNVVSNGIFVIPNITIWTGKATLKREELPVDPDKLPPDDVTKSFGSKAIYDKDKLRPFLAIKSRMRTLMMSKCMPFIGGYMCGEDQLQDVEAGLDALRNEFYNEVTKLEGEYQAVCDEWLDEHKDWAHIMQPAMPSPHEIGSRFVFGWDTVRISPVGDATEKKLDSLVDESVANMAEEIAATRESVYSKTSSKNTVKPLERLIERCKALTFMGSPHLAKLADVLTALTTLPSRETINAALAPLATSEGLQSFVDSLSGNESGLEVWNKAVSLAPQDSEPDSIISEAEQLLSGTDEEGVLEAEPVPEPVKPESVIPMAPDDDKKDGDGVFLDSFGLF